ncbi:zinc-binding dehydrogenase [Nocardiopsis dassonvillei]|uniref:zinc-binding dehydrogenase n=1 Tax=Nocardiopsis dassonvillei TaxID=2014 RepID=UPI0033E52EEC
MVQDPAGTGIRTHVTQPAVDGREALRDVLALIEAGRLRVPITGTHPPDEAAAALEESRAGHVSGKLVLLP